MQTAHAATGVSFSAALAAWLPILNELAALGASLVAIAAGCYAIATYIRKLRE